MNLGVAVARDIFCHSRTTFASIAFASPDSVAVVDQNGDSSDAS